MLKRYLTSFLVLFLFVTGFNARAQKVGDLCDGPIIARPCDSATFTVETDSFLNDVSNWNGSILTPGPDVFYQVNIPSTPFATTKVNAVFTGHFNATKIKKSKVYLMWYESGSCASTPIKIDSFRISSNSFAFPDSFIISYNVTSSQPNYYLAVDFADSLLHPDSVHNANYEFTIHFGFENNQPHDQMCDTLPKPYRGLLQIDTLSCFTYSNPYNLPLIALADSDSLTNVLLPLSIPQLSKTLPLNDQYRLGFNLDLKRIIIDSSQKQEVYITYDRFPYIYAKHAKYVVGLTVFMKNKTGTEGLRGFRMKIKHAPLVKGSAIPTDSARGGYYVADTMAHWSVTYDTIASTCTWIFKDSIGRGDNIKSKYSCETYTFSVMVDSLSDTIRAWYLPDHYGHDSIGCLRTDCAFGDYGGALPAWIELLGSGSFGGGRGITGTDACSNNKSTCSLGAKLLPCPETIFYNTCPAGMVGSTPYIQYFDDGCYQTITPITDYLYARDFSSIGNGLTAYDTICPGLTSTLSITQDQDILTTVIFTDSFGVNHPVDNSGNIDFNTDYDLVTNHNHPNLSGLPAYPIGPLTIQINTAGDYTLRSIYIDPDGHPHIGSCYGIFKLTVLPKPHVVTTVEPDTICRGDQAMITADSAMSFEWLPDTTITANFGQQVQVKPYYTTTYYVIGKNSKGCVDTVQAIVNVKVCPPIAGFSFVDSACANYPDAMFTDTSKHSPDTWVWTFEGGDPSVFVGQNPPPVKFDTAGTYTVKQVVTNTGGSDSMILKIVIKDCRPKAAFDTIVDFCAIDSTIFTDASSANTTGWLWDFPGGNPSSFNGKTPPPVFYTDPGTYTATLIASNIYGKDTATRNFTVNDCRPVAQYDKIDTSCAPECISFFDESDKNPTSWQWFFQGATPTFTTEKNPHACYQFADHYPVIMIATNRYGSDTLSFIYNVAGCIPVAAFILPDSICRTDCATIVDSSYKQPAFWSWTFDGGVPSTYSGQFPPVICYAKAGSYPVKLVVSNPNGADSLTKFLEVKKCTPHAAFDSPDSICHTDCATITNNTSDNATSWDWTFDGGLPSTFSGENPPVVCYADAGVYTIRLIASNQYGSDTTTRTIYANKCLPVPAFISPDSICHSDCATITDASLRNPDSWEWTFDGGTPSSFSGQNPPVVCYANAGEYNIQLIVSNKYGSDTTVATIVAKVCAPHASFVGPDTLCNTDCSSFVSNSTSRDVITSWEWSFPGGSLSTYSGETPPAICYNAKGVYDIQLIVSDKYGSDTITGKLVVKTCPPHASFTHPDSLCHADCASYASTSTSADNITSWEWSFPGGSPAAYSGETPPAICYNSKGAYDVQLIVEDRYGIDTAVEKIHVTDCSPFASFNANDSICRTECVPMHNLWQSNVLTWEWSFPGGRPASFSGQTPPNICYDTLGHYTASLIVTNPYGGDTVTENFVVSDCKPLGSFAFRDTICKTQCVGIPSPVSNNATSWQWSFPGGSPSTFNGENPPPVCYDSVGTYGITVIFSNPFGHDTVYVANCVTVTSLSSGFIIVKGDTLTSPSADNYQWYLNNQPISGATEQTYIAKQNGNYSVSFANKYGCSKYISVGIGVGVNTADDNFGIAISPNPNNGLFNVSFTGVVANSTIEIYNILGERVEAIPINNTKHVVVDLSAQPEGVYFVRVQTEKGTVMRRIEIIR